MELGQFAVHIEHTARVFAPADANQRDEVRRIRVPARPNDDATHRTQGHQSAMRVQASRRLSVSVVQLMQTKGLMP